MSEVKQLKGKAAVFPHRRQRDIFSFHNQGEFGASAIVSEKGRLAFVPIPKNACSSLKLFFFELINGEKFTGDFTRIHGRFSYAAIHFDRFAEDRDHFKFAVVRDPLSRFVSAYNNRVLGYKELSRHWITSVVPNPEKMLALFAERALLFDPDIREFARRIDDYVAVSSNIRHHFLPQYYFLHGRPEAFDRIYNIKQLPALAQDLSARVDREVQFPKVQDTQGKARLASLGDLDAAERDKITAYYQEDFRLLGNYL